MFFKLVKHDIKSASCGFLSVCAAIAVVSALSTVAILLLNKSDSAAAQAAISACSYIYSIAYLALKPCAAAASLIYFYKSRLSRSSGFMRSLPLGAWSHLSSVMLAAGVLYTVAIVVELVVELFYVALCRTEITSLGFISLVTIGSSSISAINSLAAFWFVMTVGLYFCIAFSLREKSATVTAVKGIAGACAVAFAYFFAMYLFALTPISTDLARLILTLVGIAIFFPASAVLMSKSDV
jgi:hypothetical protein